MKRRNGFVSNSSSTGFIFVTKTDDVEDLIKILENSYSKDFNISYSDWRENRSTVTPEEVFECIRVAMESDDENYASRFGSITEKIKSLRKDYNHFVAIAKEDHWYHQLAAEKRDQIYQLVKLKGEGFKFLVEISFGDHDGLFAGTSVGLAMDYEGRYISINDENLVLFTEQWR